MTATARARRPKILEMFPNFMARQDKGGGTPTYRRPKCVGPVAPKTLAPLEEDVAHMQAALVGARSRSAAS